MKVVVGYVRAFALACWCAVLLTVASVRIALTPRTKLVASFGTARPSPVRPRGTPPPPITDTDELRQFHAARRVGLMVERVAAVLPWHPTCLRQALATRWILRRRRIPSLMHIGVANAYDMDAHAWVTVHGWSVVGKRPGKFIPVVSFAG